ncbi:hypothetical protein [Undibacterium sp. Ren11W]|uniref:hypothetical protein n=1 Tax=Undibacterium sp. Ren11W TaxID=3413045 RepID=UPI003BF405E8
MFSLQALRFFEQAAPKLPNSPVPQRQRLTSSASEPDQVAERSLPEVERRYREERRASDRREQKHATFLDTRKRQGRRCSNGRRQDDSNVGKRTKTISVLG